MIVTLSILAIQSAAAAAERLSDLGYNTTAVAFTGYSAAAAAFTGDAFTITGRYYDDSFGFTMSVTSTTDEIGTVTAACEFMSGQRDAPLRFAAGSDDIVTAVYLAIDDHL